MKFSAETIQKAIKSTNNELAWKKENIFQSIDELIENNYAILGGEAWAVVKNTTKLSRLMQIDAETIAVGMIPDKNGMNGIYSWSIDKIEGESWNNYVLRSKAESINAINTMDVENDVAEEFKNTIYYNLSYDDETG